MARIKIENNHLIITMQGIRRFGALKKNLRIPLDNISRVFYDKAAWSALPNPLQKRAGANIYGLYFGGYFSVRGDKLFYDLKKKKYTIVLELKNHKLKRVIIGVDDPCAAVRVIESAMGRKSI